MVLKVVAKVPATLAKATICSQGNYLVPRQFYVANAITYSQGNHMQTGVPLNYCGSNSILW